MTSNTLLSAHIRYLTSRVDVLESQMRATALVLSEDAAIEREEKWQALWRRAMVTA